MNIVGVAWTLSHELLFYTFFGLVILSRRIGGVILGVWIAALLGARFFSTLLPPLNFLLHVKNLEFFMGMAVAKLLLDTHCRAGWRSATGVVVLFVATAVVELRGGYDFLEAWPSLCYGAGAALMIFARGSLEIEHRIFLIPRPLVFVGAASYSIYLIHFTIAVGLVKAAHVTGFTERLEPLLLFFTIATAASCGGIVLYLTTERPLLRAAHRAFREGSTEPRSLTSSAAS